MRTLLKHPQYEYVAYCRVSNAKPYIIPCKFYTFKEVKDFIEEIEERFERDGKSFYIDNDFYENKYCMNEKGTYYKFYRRPVSDWEVVA